MHVHGIRSMHMPERTSLGRPQRARGEAGDSSSGRGSALELAWRRAAAVGVDGRERRATCEGTSGWSEGARQPIGSAHERAATAAISLYACQDAVSGCSRGRDGLHVRPVQRGTCQSELVGVSKRSDACTCMPDEHPRGTSVPRARRLCRRRRGWWRWPRPRQRALGLGSSSRGRR